MADRHALLLGLQQTVNVNLLGRRGVVCGVTSSLAISGHWPQPVGIGPNRWPWLIYALCGGASDVPVPSVRVSQGSLTKTDLLVISAALEPNYPEPSLESDGNNCHQYGFVDIREGTELHLCGVNDDDNDGCVLSSAGRCRALYDSVDGQWVNLVVPGYGVCKVQLSDGIRFTADWEKPGFQTQRLCGSLKLNFVRFETAEVLMDLLSLVFSGLRKLSLAAVNLTRLDLSSLAKACPALQDLSTSYFEVVVSVHDKFLSRWPLKTFLLHSTVALSDLTGCLRDFALRIARELVRLQVRPSRQGGYDEEEGKELLVHDGEVLPVMKKLLAKTKAAILSVFTSANCIQEPIQGLDVYVLRLIFAFSSTLVQRSVKCSGL